MLSHFFLEEECIKDRREELKIRITQTNKLPECFKGPVDVTDLLEAGKND